jgi:hypothetical protein
MPAGSLPRPSGAHGHHRFDWLYVTAFASPATGETFWCLSDGISKPFFEAVLETFAREAEAGLGRIILLVLDNAGWHANLKIPDGIRLIYLPPYTPELQPAETLWSLVDEPIVNQHIATIEELEAKIAQRAYGEKPDDAPGGNAVMVQVVTGVMGDISATPPARPLLPDGRDPFEQPPPAPSSSRPVGRAPVAEPPQHRLFEGEADGPGRALARALAGNLDAPWLNRNGGAEHG